MFWNNKKEPKKQVYKKLVMHKDGISNFMNDSIIELTIDEPNECIVFTQSPKKDKKTANLDFEKITTLELGEKGSTLSNSSTGGAVIGGIIGGATGAVIGTTIGKKAPNIPTLKIKYKSSDVEKEINLYQCNYSSEGSIDFIKFFIEHNIKNYKNVETHVDL